MKKLHWASLTGKRRSSVLLVWLCERTFFHLIMNKQPMLKLLMVDVYLIVVSKPFNIGGGGWLLYKCSLTLEVYLTVVSKPLNIPGWGWWWWWWWWRGGGGGGDCWEWRGCSKKEIELNTWGGPIWVWLNLVPRTVPCFMKKKILRTRLDVSQIHKGDHTPT